MWLGLAGLAGLLTLLGEWDLRALGLGAKPVSPAGRRQDVGALLLSLARLLGLALSLRGEGIGLGLLLALGLGSLSLLGRRRHVGALLDYRVSAGLGLRGLRRRRSEQGARPLGRLLRGLGGRLGGLRSRGLGGLSCGPRERDDVRKGARLGRGLSRLGRLLGGA